jgi:protein SCO1/2
MWATGFVIFMVVSSLAAGDWPDIALPPEVAESNAALEKSILESGRGIALKEGDRLPEFGLINQRGEVVRIGDLRGEAFVLNFIFTRCQAAKMCPASTSRMAKLQREAPARDLPKLRFITITFDPTYDTPAVLSDYAKLYGIKGHNFDFLTHPSQAFIDQLLFLFGILTRAENGTIEHTSTTYLIDAEGRVALKQNGPEWSAEKILKAARALADGA